MTGPKTPSDRHLKVVPGGVTRLTPEPRPAVNEKPSLFPRRNYAKDELIVDIGELADICRIIVSGRVLLSIPDPEMGVPYPCTQLVSGHCFGADLSASLTPSLFQVTAMEPTIVYEIRAEDLTSEGDAPLLKSRLDYLARAGERTLIKLYGSLKTLAEGEAHWSREAMRKDQDLKLVDEQREQAMKQVETLQRENRTIAHSTIARELVERGQQLTEQYKKIQDLAWENAELKLKAKDDKANAETAMNFVTELMSELAEAQGLDMGHWGNLFRENSEEALCRLEPVFQAMLEHPSPGVQNLGVMGLGVLSNLGRKK